MGEFNITTPQGVFKITTPGDVMPSPEQLQTIPGYAAATPEKTPLSVPARTTGVIGQLQSNKPPQGLLQRAGAPEGANPLGLDPSSLAALNNPQREGFAGQGQPASESAIDALMAGGVGVAPGSAAMLGRIPQAAKIVGPAILRAIAKKIGLKSGELEEISNILRGKQGEAVPSEAAPASPGSPIPAPMKTPAPGGPAAQAGATIEMTPQTSTSDLEKMMQEQRTPQVPRINQSLSSAPTGPTPAAPQEAIGTPSVPRSEIEKVIAGSKVNAAPIASQYGVTPQSQALDIQDILQKPAVPLSMKDVLAGRLTKYGANAPQTNPVQKIAAQSPLENILEKRSPTSINVSNQARRSEDIINQARGQNKSIDAEMKAQTTSQPGLPPRPSRSALDSLDRVGAKFEDFSANSTMSRRLGEPMYTFTDPMTGSTDVLPESQMTVENLQSHLAKTRAGFKK